MSSSFSYDSDFLPAARRSKKRNNRPRKGPVPTPSELLERTKSELEAEQRWADQCHQLLERDDGDYLHRAEEILCLGLGSPSNSRDARAQLVLLLRLRDDLHIPGPKITLYDPAFTAEDKLLLESHLGLSVGTEPDGGGPISHALSVPTIAYMPHCDMALYESFLRQNWSRDRLSLLVLVANSLADYTENNPSHRMSEECPCIVRLAPYLACRNLPLSTSHSTAFNNIAVQRAEISALPLPDHPFWLSCKDNNIRSKQ